MKKTVLEFCYKDDELGDPMVNEYHILAMEYCTEEELKLISQYALKVNEVLSAYLKDLGIELIDFKLEFGRLADGTIVLADEISPDTCRFWDSATGEKAGQGPLPPRPRPRRGRLPRDPAPPDGRIKRETYV